MRNLICVGIAAFIIGMLSEYIIVFDKISANNVEVVYSGKYRNLEYHVEEYNEKRKLVVKHGDSLEWSVKLNRFYSHEDIDYFIKHLYEEYYWYFDTRDNIRESSFVTFKPAKEDKK